jgi:hypothetical protein
MFLAPKVALAREALGAGAYDAASTLGRALPLEEALAAARAWLQAADERAREPLTSR